MEEKISLGSSLPQCLANNAEGSPRRLTLPFLFHQPFPVEKQICPRVTTSCRLAKGQKMTYLYNCPMPSIYKKQKPKIAQC